MTAGPQAHVSAESTARPAANPWWWWAGIALLGLLALWLHLRSGYVFPRPWPDESHFIAPALRLAAAGQLAVPELNAPNGIFWMPHGYYVIQVPLHWLRLDPLHAARMLSLLGVWGFAASLAAVAARAGVHRVLALLAAAVWLAQPLVVVSGNIARMEGPVLGLTGLALWLVATDRWPLALSASLLAPLLHPIGAVVPVAVALAGLLRAQRRPWTAAERWAVAAVGVVWAVQIAYFVTYAEVAGEHIRFQLTRKAGRAIELATAQRWWLVGIAMAGAAATARWWRRATPPMTAVWAALALSGAMVLIEIVGREMWYEVLGRDTTRALVAVAGAAALARVPQLRRSGRLGVAAGAVVLSAATVVGVQATMTTQWFGMGQAAGTNTEWRDFTAAAMEPLLALDAEAPAGATVVVDPLSGFGQQVFARRWERLTFVQPTPVTPLDTTRADYVVTTPGVPFVTQPLVEQWGAQPPVASVRSSQGTFALDLYRNPAAAG